MNLPSVVLVFTAAAGAAMSSVADEREFWIPGPASLHFGAISDGYLLSYEWQPSGLPPPPSMGGPPSLSHYRVPAEGWPAAEKDEAKVIRWLVADLPRGRVTALAEIMPDEAKGLTVIPMRMWRHGAFHRWRLAEGLFCSTSLRCDMGMGHGAWLMCMRFPLGQLETSDGRDSGPAITVPQHGPPRAPEEPGGALRRSKPGLAHERLRDRELPRGVLGIHSWTSFLPKAEALAADARPDTRSGLRVRVAFDFVLVWGNSEHHVTFFVLAENRISVWKKHWPQATSNSGDSRLEIDGWEQQATFAAPFIEPFHLAVADEAYFFVTDVSGEVYVAEEQDGHWKTRTLWKDPARPVVAMLTNSDRSAPFVFGKDFYFQLARQIEVTSCKDVTKGRADLADPMRTVLECAKVLHRRHAGSEQ